MTLAGLRPGEKLYEEKLMAEEGMKKTDYPLYAGHAFFKLDTTEFRKEYFKRFNYEQNMMCIVNRLNLSLFWYFPNTFITGFTKKMFNKVVKKGTK